MLLYLCLSTNSLISAFIQRIGDWNFDGIDASTPDRHSHIFDLFAISQRAQSRRHTAGLSVINLASAHNCGRVSIAPSDETRVRSFVLCEATRRQYNRRLSLITSRFRRSFDANRRSAGLH